MKVLLFALLAVLLISASGCRDDDDVVAASPVDCEQQPDHEDCTFEVIRPVPPQ